MLTVAYWLAMGMVAAAAGYSLVGLIAAIRFRRRPLGDVTGFTPPVSLIKPLYGADRELEANLESFCVQDYPSYEIIFSVRENTDAAVPLVRHLQQKFPGLSIRLLFTGQPRYLNAKVHALEEMMDAARHEFLVISDSDVRVAPGYLRSVVGLLAQSDVGMVTCISRGVPGRTLWSLLETLGMNTQFVSGILTAWLLIGVKFSLGPTMAIRKETVRKLGGFGCLGDYLADDFVLGELVAKAGDRVLLSDNIPDHLTIGENFVDSLRHRLRWERSSRMSRPAGYVGQIFMHGVPLALIGWALAPGGNPVALGLGTVCVALRALLAWQVGWKILRDPIVKRYWWLLPVQDLLSFVIWCWGFFGGEIVWRGHHFEVLRGGKLVPIGNQFRSVRRSRRLINE